jgi:hypothetical protein
VLRAIIAIAVISSFPNFAKADICFFPEGRVYGGFLNGEELLGLSGMGQADYTIGVIDSLFFTTPADQQDRCAEKLLACIQDRSTTQILAIVENSIRSRPEDWNKPAPLVIVEALDNPCDLSSSFTN